MRRYIRHVRRSLRRASAWLVVPAAFPTRLPGFMSTKTRLLLLCLLSTPLLSQADDKTIYGLNEHVALPDFGLEVPAKLDTGAHYTETKLVGMKASEILTNCIWRVGVAMLRMIDTPVTKYEATNFHQLNIYQSYQRSCAIAQKQDGRPPSFEMQC